MVFGHFDTLSLQTIIDCIHGDSFGKTENSYNRQHFVPKEDAADRCNVAMMIRSRSNYMFVALSFFGRSLSSHHHPTSTQTAVFSSK